MTLCILNPGQMLTDIVGQRQYKKCCRLCKTFACFFVFLGIFFIVAYYYQPLKDSLCFILYGNMTCQSTISSSLSNVRLQWCVLFTLNFYNFEYQIGRYFVFIFVLFIQHYTPLHRAYFSSNFIKIIIFNLNFNISLF